MQYMFVPTATGIPQQVGRDDVFSMLNATPNQDPAELGRLETIQGYSCAVQASANFGAGQVYVTP